VGVDQHAPLDATRAVVLFDHTIDRDISSFEVVVQQPREQHFDLVSVVLRGSSRKRFD
jgi:hypothetical protein